MVPTLLALVPWCRAHWHLLLLGYLGLMMIVLGCRRRPVSVRSRGSARWATFPDVRKTGLTRGPGIVLGRFQGSILRLGGERHVLVVGPARSGKTTTVVIPTLRTWQESSVVLDLKGSLVAATTHLSQRYVFAPNARKSEGINLLDAIRWGQPEEVGDTWRMAMHLALVESDRTSDIGQFFGREEPALLQAALLYVGHTVNAPHMGSVLQYMSQVQKPMDALKAWQKFRHGTVQALATHLMSLGAETVGKVWSGASGFLLPWLDPLLARHTTQTTFPWRDLQTGSDPMHLYLRLTPDDLTSRPFLLRLLMNQFLLTQTFRPVPRAYNHRLLICLDDMAEMGRFPLIEHIPAFYGEHGMHLLAVGQSFDQFWEVFGTHFSVLDNSAAWVVFRPNSPPSAEFMARKLGKTTVRETVERQTGRWGFRHRSVGDVLVQRDLLTSGEIQQLHSSDVLISVGGVLPILGEAIRFDEEVRL